MCLGHSSSSASRTVPSVFKQKYCELCRTWSFSWMSNSWCTLPCTRRSFVSFETASAMISKNNWTVGTNLWVLLETHPAPSPRNTRKIVSVRVYFNTHMH